MARIRRMTRTEVKDAAKRFITTDLQALTEAPTVAVLREAFESLASDQTFWKKLAKAEAATDKAASATTKQ